MRGSLASVVCVPLLLAGCGDSPVTEPAPIESCTEEPCLAAPASGFQLKSEGELIQPGEDVEYCETLALPGDPSVEYYFDRFEVAMTEFSHHLIVSAAEPGSSSDKSLVVGQKTLCSGLDGISDTPVTGSQHPYHDETFPPGVGRVLHGGQKILFDYHYLNTSSEPVQARAAVNLHQVDASAVSHVARQLSALNIDIAIPPGETRGFEATCNFTADVSIFKLVRHTHRWGGPFDIWIAGGERDGEHVWTSSDYEDTDHSLAEPIDLKDGEGLRYRCEFTNTTTYTLYYGLEASDEMCNLFGNWTGDEDAPDQFCFNDD